MKEQEVYIKVSVEEELPESGNCIVVLDNFECQAYFNAYSKVFNYVDATGDIINPTHWLKPITTIALTPEEMKKEMTSFLKFVNKDWVSTHRNMYTHRSKSQFETGIKSIENLYGLYPQSKEDKPTR